MIHNVARSRRRRQAQWPNTEINVDEGAMDSELVASIVADLLRLGRQDATA